jgi:predicted AAA+ superfamily ATPase
MLFQTDLISIPLGKLCVLLQSLARNISTMATARTIIEDMQVNVSSITDKTLSSYLNALRRIFVVEDVPAWQRNLHFKV